MSEAVSGYLRNLRSIFPYGSSDEKIGFARFHNEPDHMARPESTEMDTIYGNDVISAKGDTCDGKGGNDGEKPEGGFQNGGFPSFQADEVGSDDHKAERNRITEWQAGWNVTNAIQVGVMLHCYGNVTLLW